MLIRSCFAWRTPLSTLTKNQLHEIPILKWRLIDVDAFSLSRSSAYKELYFPRKILKADVDVSTHHYFIVVVVVVDDDTYYWAYLSSDHLFQVYCKVRQLFFITKCDGLLLQSATAFLLQSATGITECDNFITKCNDYYKVRQYIVYLARYVAV